MKRTLLLLIGFAFIATKNQSQTVTDYDGNLYNPVTIGNQVWLKENLKVTHYRNGTSIPHISGGGGWSTLATGARCYYNNDSIAFDSVYGALYNWYAAGNANGICPTGWHVPTDAEWTAAEIFLGGSNTAGGKMKEAGTLHWLSPNAGATNSSGFTGIPGGMLSTSFVFQTLGENGLWWTATQSGGGVWSRYLWYMFAGVDRNLTPKTIALSIRCIKDVNVGQDEIRHPGIRVYPNPSKDKITVELTDGELVTLQVCSSTGVPVMKEIIDREINQVNISGLVSGIYVITLTCDSWTVQQKFIKE